MTCSKNTNIEYFKTVLKKYGLKATPQRLAVHEAMMKLGHASADMVTAEIRSREEVKVTIASVYNILTNLALLGIYNHRMSLNNKMYFDVNTFKHLHLYDCENHIYKDVMDDELIALVEKHLGRRKFKGYSVDHIDIQLVVHPTRKKTSALGTQRIGTTVRKKIQERV